MKTRLLIAALVVLPALSACQRTGGLAPVTMVGNTPDSAGGAIIVQRGDNAYTLSRRYNVPLRDLLETNNLQPPYTLAIGQRLVLPSSRQYVVQRGDTLYGISRMYGVEVSELTRLNHLSPPYAVQAGQPLRLPGAGHTDDAMVAQGPTEGAPVVLAPAAQPVSRGGAIQATELPPPGGTPAPSAQTQNQTQPQPIPPPPPAQTGVAAAPQAEPTYQPGQAPTSLRLPGQKPAQRPAQTEVATAEPPRPAPSLPEPAAKPEPAPKPVPEAAAPLPAHASSRFLWPVKGKVISTFGPKPDGMHNDGINIAAAKGSPVVAADNGVVAYSGNELRGFGNLLLIKHADGYITAYAHLDSVSVERGASVRRGQVIGRVGQTGAVTSPQLHFELRKGSQAIDPRERLDPTQVSQSN